MARWVPQAIVNEHKSLGAIGNLESEILMTKRQID
jgi:hypothetical protein